MVPHDYEQPAVVFLHDLLDVHLDLVGVLMRVYVQLDPLVCAIPVVVVPFPLVAVFAVCCLVSHLQLLRLEHLVLYFE